MFTEGLLAAYPDAKVLITNRDEDTWIWSVSSLFNTLLGWNWGLMAPYDPVTFMLLIPPRCPLAHNNAYRSTRNRTLRSWPLSGTNGPRATGTTPRASARPSATTTPSSRRRSRRTGCSSSTPREGWGSLCRHLGKEVPEGPYPHLNDLSTTVAFHNSLWWRTLPKAVQTIGRQALVPTSAVAAARLWYWCHWRWRDWSLEP